MLSVKSIHLFFFSRINLAIFSPLFVLGNLYHFRPSEYMLRTCSEALCAYIINIRSTYVQDGTTINALTRVFTRQLTQRTKMENERDHWLKQWTRYSERNAVSAMQRTRCNEYETAINKHNGISRIFAYLAQRNKNAGTCTPRGVLTKVAQRTIITYVRRIIVSLGKNRLERLETTSNVNVIANTAVLTPIPWNIPWNAEILEYWGGFSLVESLVVFGWKRILLEAPRFRLVFGIGRSSWETEIMVGKWWALKH